MKLKEWLKDNMDPKELCAPEMEIGDAVSILKDELLDEDWCVTHPCNGKQALAEAVCSVVNKFGRLWHERIADNSHETCRGNATVFNGCVVDRRN